MTEEQILASYGLDTTASERDMLLAFMARLLLIEERQQIVPQKGGGA